MIISTKQQLVYSSCVCLVSPTVPSAPALDSTPTVTATTITISGSVEDDGSVVSGFVVHWQRATCPDYGSTTVTLSSLTGYTLTGLEDGNTYNITVAATNTAGSGPVSNAVITMTTETGKAQSLSPWLVGLFDHFTLCPAPSGAPASLTLGPVTANSVTLQWGAVPCLHRNGEITGYTVIARNSDGIAERSANINAAARQAVISGLTPSTQYTLSLAAVNGAGVGPFTTVSLETPGEI